MNEAPDHALQRTAPRVTLGDASGTSVIAFSETIALAGGETFKLTANQSSGSPLDIIGGELEHAPPQSLRPRRAACHLR